jgi:hypothetical protein
MVAGFHPLISFYRLAAKGSRVDPESIAPALRITETNIFSFHSSSQCEGGRGLGVIGRIHIKTLRS